MNTADIIIAACTVVTTLIAIKFWLLSGIEKRLDKIETSVEKLGDKIDVIDRRVSIIEGYLMGRDFRNTGSGK